MPADLVASDLTSTDRKLHMRLPHRDSLFTLGENLLILPQMVGDEVMSIESRAKP